MDAARKDAGREAVDRRSGTGYHAARVIGVTAHPHPPLKDRQPA